jgi:hypothetical protein
MHRSPFETLEARSMFSVATPIDATAGAYSKDVYTTLQYDTADKQTLTDPADKAATPTADQKSAYVPTPDPTMTINLDPSQLTPVGPFKYHPYDIYVDKDRVLHVSGGDEGERIRIQNYGDHDVDVFYNGEQVGRYDTWSFNSIDLQGNGGDDTLWIVGDVAKAAAIGGGAGNDVLHGGAGGTTFDGGADVDTANYTDATTAVRISLDDDGGDGILQPDGTAGYDNVFSTVENVATGSGNDTVTGSDAANDIRGGAGDDDLSGGGGADRIDGEDGFDVIRGDRGDDRLFGGNDADRLYGGADNDALDGGAGEDSLVTIGGGQLDRSTGGSGLDTFWVDAETSEIVTDADLTERGHVHRVGGFEDVTRRLHREWSEETYIERTSISRELEGQDLVDPVISTSVYGDITEWVDSSYRSFRNSTLFSRMGIRDVDANQGNLGDCWLISTLEAVARRNPDVIRQRVVDLGDGTYSVQFNRGGRDVFYRVDGHLPAMADGNPNFAWSSTGTSWVCIIEKAFAYFRSDEGSYSRLNGGLPSEVFRALGFEPDGTGLEFSGEDLLRSIRRELAAGKAVVACTPVHDDRFNPLVGNHCFEVLSVDEDATGRLTMTVRNPWGRDGGAGDASDPSDGVITVSAAQAWRAGVYADWANVGV